MILERWKRYLRIAPFTNQHAVTPILSQYYDTPELGFYRQKLDGVAVRNKLRLRYRIKDFHPDHLHLSHWLPNCDELEPAFHILYERCRLRPTAQVYYQREAYEGLVESDVRVTFDTNLIGLYPGEQLTSRMLRDPARLLMPDTLTILEVKATHALPNWLQEGVLAAELQAKTIPKYITAVEMLGLPARQLTGVYAWTSRYSTS
jgi:hypothetical protein